LPHRKGKMIVAAQAITADQIIIAGPVVYCPWMMEAMNTPWIVQFMRITVSLDSLVKNS